MTSIQKITPSLWFEDNCEEAINFYISIFPNSRIVTNKYYPEGVAEGPMAGMKGKILTGVFELAGQRFMALDGGPVFKFTGAISFVVECDTQEEIDHYWKKLSAVPEAEQCGWCTDKYGVTWQIIPSVLGEMMLNEDPQKVARVIEAFMPMKKFDISKLEAAYRGDN